MFYFVSVHNKAILDQCVVVDEYVCVCAGAVWEGEGVKYVL